MQLATALTYRKPERRNRIGEILEGLSGSKSVACSERSIRNLGDPFSSSDLPIGGRTYQPQEERSMGLRESDHLILLRIVTRMGSGHAKCLKI